MNLKNKAYPATKEYPAAPGLKLNIRYPEWLTSVFHQKTIQRYILIALLGGAGQFTIFKIFYPFPDFISDSYSYIDTNMYDMGANLWPIGYSKFLMLIHGISHSHVFLIFSQYLLLEFSLIYFFISILYLYSPSRITQIILFIFLFFNPLFIYISNAVLSDALFASLSIIFLSQFLWMLHKPTLAQVIIQGIIIE